MTWAKIDLEFLDGDHMQAAIGESPFVVNMAIWCITTAGKKKSDCIEFDQSIIRGIARRLNISPEDVSSAAKLLSGIGFISIEEDFLMLPKWCDFQSRYLHERADRKAKRESAKIDRLPPPSAAPASGVTQRPSTELNPDIPENPATKESTSRGGSERGESDAMFEEFWKAYPRKVKKVIAHTAWKKIKVTRELLDKMLETIEAWRPCNQWTEENGRFIPHPATWLNAGGWDDEAPEIDDDQEDEIPYTQFDEEGFIIQ